MPSGTSIPRACIIAVSGGEREQPLCYFQAQLEVTFLLVRFKQVCYKRNYCILGSSALVFFRLL